MSRWCVWYACTKDVVDHARFVLENEEVVEDDPLHEEVLRHFPESLPHYAINHAWDEIHRCLTGDVTDWMDFDSGDYPLKLCVHGGESLRDATDSVTLVDAEEIPPLCRALAGIERDWMKERLLALPASELSWYRGRRMDDDDVEDVWSEFCALRRFYLEAERLKLPVICTISH